MLGRVKYPLTPEAKDAARRLVQAWDAGQLAQSFELTDVTSGADAKRSYTFGLGGDDKAMMPPDLGIIRELEEYRLLAIRERSEPLKGTRLEVTLLQELRNAVQNDFRVSDYFLTITAVGTIVHGNQTNYPGSAYQSAAVAASGTISQHMGTVDGAVRHSADEPIPGLDGRTIGDFWAWAYSDVLSNVSRGVYAEYLVGAALGSLDGVRIEWDDYDLSYRGAKIEVKSAAYRQSWAQEEPSEIRFNFSPKKGTGQRSADVYVFCLFTDEDESTAAASVLDPAFWEFYVLAESELPAQRSLGLGPLHELCKGLGRSYPVRFEEIQEAVDSLVAD